MSIASIVDEPFQVLGFLIAQDLAVRGRCGALSVGRQTTHGNSKAARGA
jgi:hypothetical protein